MKTFIDLGHLPGIPKSYTFAGTDYRLNWGSNMPWQAFYSQIVAFAQANNLPVPSSESVQDDICTRLPQGWCTGEPNYRPPATPSSSCRSCGGW